LIHAKERLLLEKAREAVQSWSDDKKNINYKNYKTNDNVIIDNSNSKDNEN